MIHNTSSSNSYTYTIRPATVTDLSSLPAVEASAATLFNSDPSLVPLTQDEPMAVETHEASLRKWTALEIGEGGTYVAVSRQGPNSDEVEGEVAEHEKESEEIVIGFIVTELLPILRQRGVERTFLDHDGVGEGAESEADTDADTDATGAKLYFLHINELSIHAAHQRKGVASRLLGAVKECAQRLSTPTPSLHGSLRVVGLSLTTMRDVPFNAPFYARFGFHEIPIEGKGGVGDVIGEQGLEVWRGDQEHFAAVGDGTLRSRRCWMVCDVSLKG